MLGGKADLHPEVVPTLVWNNRVDTVQMFNVLDHVNALDANGSSGAFLLHFALSALHRPCHAEIEEKARVISIVYEPPDLELLQCIGRSWPIATSLAANISGSGGNDLTLAQTSGRPFLREAAKKLIILRLSSASNCRCILRLICWIGSGMSFVGAGTSSCDDRLYAYF